LILLAAPVVFTACGKEPAVSGPPAIRLVDLFSAAEVQASGDAPAEAPSRIEWTFGGPGGADPNATGAATLGWAADGVTGFEIRDKLLVGQTTSEFPLLYANIQRGRDDSDRVHAVEVRASVTKGSSLAVAFQSSDEADPGALRRPQARLLGTPLYAGQGMKDYAIRCPSAVRMGDVRRLLIRPSDVADADFEVASVRVVTLKEHLAENPAGVGWHGLDEIYQESLVARAPVTMRFEVTLQARPWLDMAVGTISDGQVTFRVGLSPAGQAGDDEKILIERTATSGQGWQPARVDLADYAGENVALTLRLEAPEPGAVGFWGSPVVRNSGARTAAAKSGIAAGAMPPQGVILIMADGLRRDHLSAYGYDRETAPVLERLASEGTLFQDCVSQATWTKASAPSILTSLYPTAHTVHGLADRLPSAARTLAEVYREAGYATLSLSLTPSTGERSNLHQGFETLHEATSLRAGKRAKSMTEYVDRLLPWLDTHRETPFFVFLHVFDADAFAAERRELHDRSIRDMDAETGRILEGLSKLGLADKTVVAFVGDHGEEFQEHGKTGHGHSVYGELANVPLLLRLPGAVPAGQAVEATVQTIDVMPTLLVLSGLGLPEGTQGSSLLPLLAPGGGGAGAPAVTEQLGRTPSADHERGSDAIIMDGWKLIHNLRRAEGQPEFELYNHREDPLDQANVAAEQADLVERLSTELAGWRERALSLKLPSDAEAMSDASAEELGQLQSLGYL